MDSKNFDYFNSVLKLLKEKLWLFDGPELDHLLKKFSDLRRRMTIVYTPTVELFQFRIYVYIIVTLTEFNNVVKYSLMEDLCKEIPKPAPLQQCQRYIIRSMYIWDYFHNAVMITRSYSVNFNHIMGEIIFDYMDLSHDSYTHRNIINCFINEYGPLFIKSFPKSINIFELLLPLEIDYHSFELIKMYAHTIQDINSKVMFRPNDGVQLLALDVAFWLGVDRDTIELLLGMGAVSLDPFVLVHLCASRMYPLFIKYRLFDPFLLKIHSLPIPKKACINAFEQALPYYSRPQIDRLVIKPTP